MQSPIFLKSLLFLFVLSLTITSCKQDNIEEIEVFIEEIPEEEVQSVMALTINDITTNYDAYAAYCTNTETGDEFIQISNNEFLLDTIVFAEDIQINDFVILTTISSEQSTSIASAVIQDSLNGVPVNNFVFDAEASILIDEINEEYVEGSMSGNFMSLSGNSISYSVEFTAEIISAVTWCQ